MKKFLVQFVALIIVIAGALLLYTGSLPSLPFIPEQAKYSELTINETKLKVEIADTQEKRSKGLGGRESLATDQGMLFIFQKADKHSFWMKGLKFPLDFIWIKGGQVVDITINIKPPDPNQKDKDLPIYVSKTEADKVLEVNAGIIERLNIKAGDTIKLIPI